MSRTNQVRPASTIVTDLHTSNSFQTSATIDNETANAYLTLLRKHVSRKFCYHSDAAVEAKIIKVDTRVGFQVDIWTLMEKRWIKTISSPYNGENTPSQNVQDIFDEENYNLKADTTVVKGRQIGHIALPETQRKIICVACNGQGKKTCSSCDGSGQVNGNILQRTEMHCKRYTLHSVTYPKNTFLPDKCIKNSNGKNLFFEDDVL
ncbi:unnamed protein product, partial [Rotaria sp. Silwood1]